MPENEGGGFTFINYAHRGASAYAPENTMRAFRLGVELGANGIETDIRKTHDGVLVLFHDETLLRLTGAAKKPAELTYEALSRFPIPAPDGSEPGHVPRLTDFLAYAKTQDVFLALELKTDGIEAEVLRAVNAFGLREKSVVTSFGTERLRSVKALDRSQKTGLLTAEVNEALLRELKLLGVEQICPKADIVTPALVDALHEAGFSVRAWGVKDAEAMRRVYRCGVNGMTVNFPDKLQAYIAETEKEKE